MALGEVRLGDWWRVVNREFVSGLGLGAILAAIGATRILIWQALFHSYGPYYPLVTATVAVSLVGVVLWGTVAGSMLPFILRRLGVDPALASAPLVGPFVVVRGLVVFFLIAPAIIPGPLL